MKNYKAFKDVWYTCISIMTTVLAGMNDSVLITESTKSGWKIHKSLVGTHPQGIAFDPLDPSRAYCGTFGAGLWSTDDCGESWNQIGKDSISNHNVTSVSVSRLERGTDGFNVVYVGTEPSEFYRSDDGGLSWQRMIGLNRLHSSRSWSFPPRPWTHHVRWIEPDVNTPGHVFVAIEAGALVQSHDGGRTWIDRSKQGPFDTHTLATHRKAPKRLYSSAGDGYFESFDYGETWSSPIDGLNHHYLYGLVVDPGNPQNLVVSASTGPWQAHSAGQDAESYLYRRSDDGKLWELISKGLPEPRGTMIAILAGNPKTIGELYLASNRGLFWSTDLGLSWNALDISWPGEYLLQHAWSLAIQEQ
ncbi:MAG: WD40/YVTN/BNR-like repeat-containing protein [Nitrososphaera sp.]